MLKAKWSPAALLIVLVSSVAIAAGPKWLITPDEAARAQPPAGDYMQPMSAVEGPGPQIVVRNPKVLKRLTSPIHIFVDFKPGKSRLPADMKTLNVTLVGFFNIDITDRLREYVKTSSLEIDRAELPVGNHRLRMTIKDIKGNPNQRDVVVRVVKK